MSRYLIITLTKECIDSIASNPSNYCIVERCRSLWENSENSFYVGIDDNGNPACLFGVLKQFNPSGFSDVGEVSVTLIDDQSPKKLIHETIILSLKQEANTGKTDLLWLGTPHTNKSFLRTMFRNDFYFLEDAGIRDNVRDIRMGRFIRSDNDWIKVAAIYQTFIQKRYEVKPSKSYIPDGYEAIYLQDIINFLS